jgi:hypothetical protein
MAPGLAERVMRVRLLLETLEDPYPRPHASIRPVPGPAPSRYVPCETCQRRGWLVTRDRRWKLCGSCDGRGERWREPGEPLWDAYIGMPLVEASQLPREPPRGPSDSQLAQDKAEAEGRWQSLSYVWERALAAQDRYGSYREVRRNLAWLKQAEPVRGRLIQVVLVEAQPRVLSRSDERDLDLGVVAITLRMRTVRVPPWLLERTAANQRRVGIAELAGRGMQAGEIARRLALPKSVVRRRLREMNGVRSGQAGVPSLAM